MGVRITYNFDDWDAATVTASSSSASELGAANVVDPQPSKVWRSTGDTAEWVKFDLGSAKQITCIGLFNFNFTSGATVTLQANASDSWGAPSYSQALTIAADSDSVVLKRLVYFLDQTYRWWRITIADASNPDGYVEIGRVAAGQYYAPTRNIQEQYRYQGQDPSERERLPGAWSPSVSRARYRTADVSFPFANQTQADKFWAIFDKVGNETPIILSVEPTTRPSQDSMYCTLETPLSLTNATLTYWDVVTLRFEEKVR